MSEPLIQVEKLSKSYGRRPILQSVSFNVQPGEILGIIGSSGSGKTTLLHTLIGFIKPEDGDVKYRQSHLLSPSDAVYKSIYKEHKTIKHMYGFASQLPSFYEKLTVKENLEYFGKLYDLSKETLQTNVNTLLKLMDLENSANILGKNLSGGMERRLDIACAMIHNPPILILDEPTADLDPVLRNNIWNLIQKINSKGTTIILSSHHLNEMETLCTRIAIIKKGQVLGIGSAQELIDKFGPQHEIVIQSYPGKYKALGDDLMKKFSKNITSYTNKGNELVIQCLKPHMIMNDIIKNIEKQKEKILELKMVKPNLDQIFINIEERK